jgi:adenylate cyclase
MSHDKTQFQPSVEPGSDGPLPIQEHIRKIVHRISDLTDLLRSQREILAKRAVSLPSGSLDNLRQVKQKIDLLARDLVRSQVELRQLRALAETTSLINSTLETDVVLNQVMDTVIQLTGAERGYIVMKNRETDELDQFRVARGLDAEILSGQKQTDDPSANKKKNEFIVSKTIVNDVANTGEPVLTDNASTDERYQGQQSIVGFALRSILAVPLKVRGEVIGVVYCDNRVLSGLFQDNDRDILVAFANQAGVAIENARLFEEARAQLGNLTEMRDLMNNIFDSIISGVVTTDANGNILTANAAARQILDREDFDGQNLRDVVPAMDDQQEVYGILNDVLTKNEQHLLNVEPQLADGRRGYWRLVVSPLRDDEGSGQGLAIVIDDLTEQREREAQLTEVRRYLPLALVENIRSLADVDIKGQEREITMIATDVRGFTSFSELLQPEELMEIINKYLSLASDAINLYEGIVDKYAGDAVTGLYNTQLNPQPDHAIRAVRAAMSIIYDLYALHEVLPEEQRLYYGIGVHTGPAYLGNVGGTDRKEFSALGEAATISKILEGQAGPGEIIISEATYELIKDQFECEAHEPNPDKLKGNTEITKIYKVTKRKRGSSKSAMLLDPELADLMKELGEDTK